jgi:cbb3-type cytochrome oxidase maturation protein
MENSLYILIPLSVLLVFVIGLIFWWSVRSGQFDDLEGPGFRILMDDDLPSESTEKPADGEKSSTLV